MIKERYEATCPDCEAGVTVAPSLAMHFGFETGHGTCPHCNSFFHIHLVIDEIVTMNWNQWLDESLGVDEAVFHRRHEGEFLGWLDSKHGYIKPMEPIPQLRGKDLFVYADNFYPNSDRALKGQRVNFSFWRLENRDGSCRYMAGNVTAVIAEEA